MLNKGQELNPIALIFGIVGLAIGWIIAAGLNYGIVMKIVTALLTAVINYFIIAAMSNN